MNFIAKYKENRIFIITMSLFFIGFFIIQNLNHRFWMHDFEVYWTSSYNYFHFKPVYFQLYALGSGYYKYSPIALWYFLPFSLLPFEIAKIVYFFLLAFILICIFITTKDLIYKYFGMSDKSNWILFLTLLVLLNNVYFEFHMSNANLITLLFLVLSLSSILQKKDIWAGILIALAIFIKPHFIVLYPLLLVRKKFKVLIFSISALITGLFFPVLYSGFEGNMQLLSDWYFSMKLHNSNILGYAHTIYTIGYKLLSRFINMDVTVIYITILLGAVASLFLIFIIRNIINEKKLLDDANRERVIKIDFVIEFIVLLALVPNITPCDNEHFLYSLPLVFVIVNWVFKKGFIKWYYLSIVIFAFLLYGGNWADLWGRHLSVQINKMGLMGIGNFVLIFMAVILFHRKQLLLTNSEY